MIGTRTIVVPCTILVEQTPENLHAHVALEGVEVHAGDTVLVHGEPIKIGFGRQLCLERRATVFRANWLERLWTRMTARFELSVLYEVGFSPRRRP